MSTMTDTETYNGWKNRETWAFNLHWQNDQGMYNVTLEEARRYIEETYGKAHHLIHDADERRGAYYGAAERIIEFWQEQMEEAEDEGMTLDSTLRGFRSDVGSWWRIDVRETAAALAESLDAEEVDADTDE